MTDHTTTIPAYVRTPAGVVKVGLGERVPADALPTEITRLAAAGVIVAVPQEPDATSTPAPDASSDTPPAAPESSKGRSRGRSGTSRHHTVKED